MQFGKRFRAFVVLVLASCAPFAAARDGDADTGFSDDGQATVTVTPPAEASESAYAAVEAPGGVLVGGTAVRSDGLAIDFHVVKYTQAGSIDLGFGALGRRSVGVNGYGQLRRIFLEPDGKILLAGMSSGRPALARLTAGGAIDASFGNAGVAVADVWDGSDDGIAWDVAERRDAAGRIFFVGTQKPEIVCLPPIPCPDPEDVDPQPIVIAMTRTGALDSAFAGDGIAMLSLALTANYPRLALAVDGAGRPVVAVENAGPVELFRLLGNGAHDPSWGPAGRVQTELVTGNPFQLLIDDGRRRIYLYNSFAVRALRHDGSLDPAFGNAGEAWLGQWDEGSWVRQFALQGDGKLVGAGAILPASGESDVFLIRLGVDGQPDPAFHGNGVRRVPFDLAPGARDTAEAVALAGGKPVAVGAATDADGNQRWAVLRTLNAYTFADGFE